MLLRITVKANQRQDKLWRDGEGLRAYISAVPQDGKANDYLVRYLAEYFGVAKSLISVVKGFTSSHKTVLIEAPESQIKARIVDLPEAPQQSSIW